jgi:tetratricopeptide (TPR) repeat protein
VSDSTEVDGGPFNSAPPDEAAEKDALMGALELSQGFSLIFACCNQASHRDRLMVDIQARLPDLRIQFIPLREPVRNLLYVLREVLESPPPDAVFLYGIEGWLTAGVEAEDDSFIRNLNAARNHFPREVPCPLVFWLPQHILTTLARGAADFCSVRSGIYSFSAPPEVRDRMERLLTSDGMTSMAGLAFDEKHERVETLAGMLAEYEALPTELRDPLAESRLMNSLATLHQVLGNFEAAEPLFQRALGIRQASSTPDQHTASILNDLAHLYYSRGRSAEAESLYRQALEIQEATLGPNHSITASTLNNLADLYRSEARYVEAEPLYRRALEIQESTIGPYHFNTAVSLNNLALLYLSQGRYAESEPLYLRALEVFEGSLGKDHPNTATGLYNYALLCMYQGRYAEADPLLCRSLMIREASLGPNHPETALSLSGLAALRNSQGRYAEAERFYRRTIEINEASLGSGHPHTAYILGQFADFLHHRGRDSEAIIMESRAQASRDESARCNVKIFNETASQ